MISYKVMIIQAQSNDHFFEKMYLGHFPKKTRVLQNCEKNYRKLRESSE